MTSEDRTVRMAEGTQGHKESKQGECSTDEAGQACPRSRMGRGCRNTEREGTGRLFRGGTD